nr:flagellar motor switch protein FliG [Klebsiella pneumoniae]
EFREQSGINGASRSMLQGILNKALGTEIASSVINGIYGDEIRSRMARLQWVEPRQLAMLISEEHLQLQAVFLAFLTPEISAAVLSYLNESVQNEILYRVAKLNDVNRDVVDEFREQSGINGASRSMLQGILNKALGTEIASSVI